MAAFAQWLMGFAKTWLTWLYNKIIDIIQYFSDTLADFILSLVALFPSGSPLPAVPSAPSGADKDIFITCLNWVFPMQYIVSCTAFLVAGMLAYVTIYPLAKRFGLLP